MVLFPSDYEARTVEFAQRSLDDIPECASADIQVRFFSGFPALVLRFDFPGPAKPAFAVSLVTCPKPGSLKPGTHLEGERLKRHIRQSVEDFLTRQGVRLPCPSTP